MSMVNNYYANHYEWLVTFYPRFYKDVFEMDEILKAEGKLVDGIADGIEQMLMNNFIDGADEETLTKLEEFLGLSLMKQRSLEERRRFTKSFFAGQGKVSQTRIAEMIRAYTGADTVCKFEPFDEYGNNRLDVEFERGSEDVIYISDIYTLLAKMLPAHIEYRPTMTYRFPVGVKRKQNKNYRYTYDLSGTKPETVLIAQIMGTEAATSHEISKAVIGYRISAESGTEAQSGLYPQYSTLAHNDVINAAAGVNATGCSVDYAPCGTLYSGQGG